MHRRLWARALDPVGTHTPLQTNEINSNSVFLGNVLQTITKWQSAQTSFNLRQNTTWIQSQPRIIVCLQKCMVSRISACLSMCAQQSLSKCIKHRLPFIWRCHNIIFIIYQLSKWRQNDMSPVIQFPPLIGPFLLTSLSRTIANQQQSPLSLCLDHSNQEQKHDKSKCCCTTVTCLCGHVMGYKSTVGCLGGGRGLLNCHHFQRKAFFISCPDAKFSIWHSELQLLDPLVCILCPFCASSDWTL